MHLVPRRQSLCALVALALAAGPGLARAQDSKARARDSKSGADAAQRTAGVITKVDSQGKDDARRARLTIKTDAVWRDYVRDQATNDPKSSVKNAAKKGEQSIATKGEPSSPNDRVLVDLGPDSRLELRYRAGTDEANAGFATAAEAIAHEKKAGSERQAQADGKARRRTAAKPAKLSASDLKPGLFVEVEYRRDKEGSNRITALRVIRPVGGPESPAGVDAKADK